MIETICTCGSALVTEESTVNHPLLCAACGKSALPISAEPLGDGNGAGDFDAYVVVTKGPAKLGQQFVLGGVVDLEIGKLAGKHIHLVGNQVSRNHCKLCRVDFGPSRWRIEDTKSTNGVYVNETKVQDQELAGGDVVRVGDFELTYHVAAPMEAPVMEAAPAEMHSSSAAVMAPAMMTRPVPARPLAYAAPSSEVRLLMHSDPDWVKKLKIASNLLLAAVVVNVVSALTARVTGHEAAQFMSLVGAILNLLGAWFLTMGEPNVIESAGRTVLRISVRVTSTMVAAGILSGTLGQIIHDRTLIIGGILAIAAIPQFFLFLFFLRQLAMRIPDDGLASQTMVVMIGLPLMVAIMVGSIVAGAGANSVGTAITGACVGVIGLIVFALWYLALLVRFNRAFS